jgi:hypothetical protein
VDQHPPDRLIARLIASLAGRTDAQTRELVRVLLDGRAPEERTDRREPVAVEWLRRWAPQPSYLAPVACSCKAGHCRLCN